MSVPVASFVHSTDRENSVKVSVERYGVAMRTYPCHLGRDKYFQGGNAYEQIQTQTKTKGG